MSRLALLVGAVPSKCTEGPIVRLLPGRWKMRIEGLKDSELALGPQLLTALYNDMTYEILGPPSDVQVAFVKRGTEPFINVFAEKQ